MANHAAAHIHRSQRQGPLEFHRRIPHRQRFRNVPAQLRRRRVASGRPVVDHQHPQRLRLVLQIHRPRPAMFNILSPAMRPPLRPYLARQIEIHDLVVVDRHAPTAPAPGPVRRSAVRPDLPIALQPPHVQPDRAPGRAPRRSVRHHSVRHNRPVHPQRPRHDLHDPAPARVLRPAPVVRRLAEIPETRPRWIRAVIAPPPAVAAPHIIAQPAIHAPLPAHVQATVHADLQIPQNRQSHPDLPVPNRLRVGYSRPIGHEQGRKRMQPIDGQMRTVHQYGLMII